MRGFAHFDLKVTDLYFRLEFHQHVMLHPHQHYISLQPQFHQHAILHRLRDCTSLHPQFHQHAILHQDCTLSTCEFQRYLHILQLLEDCHHGNLPPIHPNSNPLQPNSQLCYSHCQQYQTRHRPHRVLGPSLSARWRNPPFSGYQTSVKLTTELTDWKHLKFAGIP